MVGQNIVFFNKIFHQFGDECGDGGRWSGGVTGLVFSFSLFQFHKSRFCGVLFDFCRFGL